MIVFSNFYLFWTTVAVNLDWFHDYQTSWKPEPYLINQSASNNNKPKSADSSLAHPGRLNHPEVFRGRSRCCVSGATRCRDPQCRYSDSKLLDGKVSTQALAQVQGVQVPLSRTCCNRSWVHPGWDTALAPEGLMLATRGHGAVWQQGHRCWHPNTMKRLEFVDAGGCPVMVMVEEETWMERHLLATTDHHGPFWRKSLRYLLT